MAEPTGEATKAGHVELAEVNQASQSLLPHDSQGLCSPGSLHQAPLSFQESGPSRGARQEEQEPLPLAHSPGPGQAAHQPQVSHPPYRSTDPQTPAEHLTQRAGTTTFLTAALPGPHIKTP